MSWLLISDGVSTVANFTPVTIPVNEDFTIRIIFRPDSTNAFRAIVGQNSTFDNNITPLRNGVTNCVFTFGGTSYIRNYNTALVVGTVYDFEIQRVSGVVDMVDTVTQSTVISSTFTDNTEISFDKFFKNGGGTSNPFDGGLGLFQITNATINHAWDATLSSHAAGSQPTLTDTISANNALGVNFATDGSAWEDLGGSGISIAVTEVLNSFSDTSSVNIDYNVSATVTETLNPFGDTSVISVTSGQVVNLSVTETLSAFTDLSNVNVSANIDLIVTEVLNSFLDGSNVTIAKELTLQVTEVFNSFADNSSVRLPANWNDKPKVTTSYTTQTPVSTIWIDKG